MILGVTSPTIDAAKRLVEILEAAVNADNVAQRLDTYENIISRQMPSLTESPDMEHSSRELRLDLKKLAIAR